MNYEYFLLILLSRVLDSPIFHHDPVVDSDTRCWRICLPCIVVQKDWKSCLPLSLVTVSKSPSPARTSKHDGCWSCFIMRMMDMLWRTLTQWQKPSSRYTGTWISHGGHFIWTSQVPQSVHRCIVSFHFAAAWFRTWRSCCSLHSLAETPN